MRYALSKIALWVKQDALTLTLTLYLTLSLTLTLTFITIWAKQSSMGQSKQSAAKLRVFAMSSLQKTMQKWFLQYVASKLTCWIGLNLTLTLTLTLALRSNTRFWNVTLLLICLLDREQST